MFSHAVAAAAIVADLNHLLADAVAAALLFATARPARADSEAWLVREFHQVVARLVLGSLRVRARFKSWAASTMPPRLKHAAGIRPRQCADAAGHGGGYPCGADQSWPGARKPCITCPKCRTTAIAAAVAAKRWTFLPRWPIRLGVWQIKWELEDLAFRHLEPDTYKKSPNAAG